MMLLQNKNVIISGCSRGIGHAILEVFAANGANVWACFRKPSDEAVALCGQLAQEHNVRIMPVYFDLEESEQIKSAVQTIMAAKIPVHALVNNAGIIYSALFQMTSLEKMKQVFQVNFFSQFLFTQYIVKLMIRGKQGSIVSISSTAAMDGYPGRSAYGASKAALACATKVMASELAEYGIRANVIAPGIVNTDMVSQNVSGGVINATVAQTMLKRMGTPNDIANMALFLASDKSSYITGQIMRVDGGLGI